MTTGILPDKKFFQVTGSIVQTVNRQDGCAFLTEWLLIFMGFNVYAVFFFSVMVAVKS